MEEGMKRQGDEEAGMRDEEMLAAREKALSLREKELSRRELRAMATLALRERGLPDELADAVSCESPEAYEESLAKSEAAFRAAVQAEMTKRLGGMAPARGIDMQNPAALTDEQYYAWKLSRTNRT